ncbi:MAG: tetratricopeptide repeat protein [Lewinellaceae bacterium]|nr:tetratricopeptide repeat protein [Lewinellaceae bacterium]
MRKFFPVLTLLLIFSDVSAQRYPYETRTDTFFFRFFFSEEASEPYQGYFSHGSLVPETFAEGPVYPLYSEFVTEPFQSHGTASVNSIDQGTSGLSIRLSSSSDGRRIFQQLEGVVALPVKVAAEGYRGVFYDLVKNDIYLFDILNGQPFYTLDDILQHDSPSKENAIMEAMLKEAKFVAEEMVRQGMESPKVVSGRFAGMDLFQAMKVSEVSDIRSFLRYVQYLPRKYQGLNWQLAEVYATWIDGGAPSTKEDVEELLLSNLNDFSSFRKYLNSYKKEDFPKVAEMVRQRVLDLKAGGDKLNEAMGFANVSLKVSEAAEDNKNIAWAYFEIAEIQHQQELQDKAIQSYHKAIEYFDLSKERKGLLAAYNNLGNCLNEKESREGYEEALLWLNKAEAIKSALGNNEEGSATIAQLYRNLGDSYAGLKKYKKAVEIYDTGLTYTTSNSPLSLKRRSMLYIQLADVYEKLNKKEEAEEYTRKGVMTYKHYEEMLAKQTKT